MQNACKDAAEKFAALDLNWWTCIPEEVIGPDLQEMRNIHLRLKPTPWIASDWGRGTGERAPPVLSARIRVLNFWDPASCRPYSRWAHYKLSSSKEKI